MSNPLFVGKTGMAAVVSSANANFGVEQFMQQQLTLISSVPAQPSPSEMASLVTAYQFFQAMWSQGSFTANGVNVNFGAITDPSMKAMLPQIHSDLTALFSSYNNVTLPSPDGGTMQLKDENGNPISLLDLVTGRPDDPKFQITAWVQTDGNQSSCDWYDGDLDDATGHGKFWAGAGDQTGHLNPSSMPPGFSCSYDTYCANCGWQNHTHFDITIDPNATASAAEKNIGVKAGETGLQWLQQHCSVNGSAASAQDLQNFDSDFQKIMQE